MEAALGELREQLGALLTVATGPKSAVAVLPAKAPDYTQDLYVLAIYAIVFFLFNWITRLCVVEPVLAKCLAMRSTHLKRCSQSILEATFYGSFSVLGLLIVPSQPWVWPSEQWWIGIANGGHAAMRSDLRGYYLAYLGRYVQMLLSVMLEPKRKDFPEMVLHHLVTIVVISLSYVYGWNRVGAVTMVLLDPADVPLQAAKVCKYLSEATKSRYWQMLADRFFELFALTFFVSRLVMYGYVAVWSVAYEGTVHVPSAPACAFSGDCKHGGWAGAACVLILWILLALQCYWFMLIVKVATRHFRDGKPVEDVRSDDDSPPATPTPRRDSVSRWWPVILSMPMLGFALQQAVAYGTERSAAEITSVLHGLRVVLSGGGVAAASLPHSAPEMARDTMLTAVFTLVFFAINWGLRFILVEPLAKWTLGLRRSQLEKYAQSVLEAINYGTFMIIGLAVVPSQEWVWPSWQWWKGFADGGHEVMRSDLRCFYIMYIARYIQALLSVLLETKRKDFVEMIVHHIVTVVVIYISYVYGWNRVGVVVMVLLDPADVPLHLAKLCKYTSEATGRRIWQVAADRLFEVFALVFFVTRLVMYGYVCWSAHIEATRYFPKGVPEWTCVALLYTLLLLQMYWFFLIIRVAVKLLRGQDAEDPRSDSEDEGSQGKATNGSKGEAKKDK